MPFFCIRIELASISQKSVANRLYQHSNGITSPAKNLGSKQQLQEHHCSFAVVFLQFSELVDKFVLFNQFISALSKCEHDSLNYLPP